ncbi:hypothetical protein Pla175_46710 [Pirellulimonas nuda]|uniref:DUF1570 domain-containing protein n=1 Tax=Pirellulimonas nuda TaxID=2528009 RepID=A0A518DIE6_9BACT|nr:DUF1570 domain-containing protein [Pirellulimonas nuda]QDU91251.1 hypothetical protein Pla175_46710 [Pirellulimonas nuda]
MADHVCESRAAARPHAPRTRSPRLAGAGLTWVVIAAIQPVWGADFMFRAEVDGQTVEGSPLAWSESSVSLLTRDGSLIDLDPQQVSGATKTAPRFQGYPATEVAPRLRDEFGSGYDVASSTHFLVVYPRGDRRDWAARFEALYRSLTRYAAVRDFPVSDPAYPLVAIVYPSEAAYYTAIQQMGISLPSGMLGHYDPQTNRVYLFDPGDDWEQPGGSAATIIHEATHQAAFNVGLHTRFAEAPRWLTEGLATLFEARGVWAPRTGDRPKDRYNRGRLADYRRYAKEDGPPMPIGALVASDDAFKSQPLAAYAQAWALTFYLSETRPRQYAQYLQTTANRPNFASYDPRSRLNDFKAAFGDDLRLLDANFASWMKSLE